MKKEIIARLRNAIKEVSADSVYSNRYLWHAFATAAKKIIRTAIERGSIFYQNIMWESVCIKMVPISSLLCNCYCLPYNCMVYRSEKRIPMFLEGPGGMAYRFIASPDLSEQFTLVTPYQYQVRSKIKYNKEKYVFYHDGYLYTPNATFPQIIVSAIFEEDITKFDCAYEPSKVKCGTMLESKSFLPTYLEDDAIKMALQELGMFKQVQQDELPNANTNQNQISL